MNEVDFLNSLLAINPSLRFSGLVEKSGHLSASVIRQGISEHLKGRNPEISYTQSAYIIELRKIFENELGNLNSVIYIYDKVIMFSIPIRNHIVVISSDKNIDIDSIFKQVQSFIKNSETELDLELDVKNISQDKKESVRNLYDSGISEEMIAEQVDLNLATVKSLIKIITTSTK
ncbi:MAG: hypothetical protein EHM25_02220 [Nitrosopumilales archaeon]|nr:MAG: hypothetical protein EHM25_02220 [Nitrosopumilales archaeon]